jgi:acyl-CoA synthetase (AMP-forming)/AMP-acid ligase II
MTYGELSGAAERLAAALAVRDGERVMIVAPNTPALAVGVLAAWQSGAVAVPLSSRLGRFELERAFADCRPIAAISAANDPGSALVQEIAQSAPTVRVRLVLDENAAVLDATRRDAAEPSEPSPSGIVVILYTSGTTGAPKGVLMPDAMLDAVARTLPELLGAHAAAPYGLVVPASHAFGLACLVCGMIAGAAAVMVDATASIGPLMQALAEHRAEVLHGSPALFGRVLRAGVELAARTGFVAGSWCPPDLLEELDQRQVRVLNLYGMTELGAVTACRPEDPPSIRYGTVGRALAGVDVRVAPGDPSEIQVRCPWLPPGYHGRPWGEDELTGDGWFRTGDLGVLDGAGNLTIAGRAKEVIHVGGFNVFPAEIETFLLTHPEIVQAAVIGAPHPVLGEAPRAFVVPAAGAELEPRDVIRFARGAIAGYKVPYNVRVVEQLPLLASGKPDRRELSRIAEREESVR